MDFSPHQNQQRGATKQKNQSEEVQCNQPEELIEEKYNQSEESKGEEVQTIRKITKGRGN